MYIKLFAKWQSNVFLVVLLSLLSSSSCSSYSASFSGCRCILFLIFSCAVVYSFVYVIPSCASSFITHSLTHSPVAHCCYRLLCLLNLICRVLLFSPVIYHQYKISVYSNHFCLTVYFHFQALWLFSFCSFYFVVSTVPMICACIFVVLCWQRCLGVYKYTQTKYHQIDKWASIARVSERTNERRNAQTWAFFVRTCERERVCCTRSIFGIKWCDICILDYVIRTTSRE